MYKNGVKEGKPSDLANSRKFLAISSKSSTFHPPRINEFDLAKSWVSANSVKSPSGIKSFGIDCLKGVPIPLMQAFAGQIEGS